ncbi:hypothetical protein PsorP6_008280 [Peronosclerospora sorghi]|uniref:Uncharacterized protein n=1 Tax=Peronosclerospora sorghi TaxID=230839 RepID=A0ACC0WCR8_9STRA|nr:hypothetical protein PsorP6_008280 [Peronosclerospora sorghi]
MDFDDEVGPQDTQPPAAAHVKSPPVEHPIRVDDPEEGWQEQGRLTIEQASHPVMVFHPSARRLGRQTVEAFPAPLEDRLVALPTTRPIEDPNQHVLRSTNAIVVRGDGHDNYSARREPKRARLLPPTEHANAIESSHHCHCSSKQGCKNSEAPWSKAQLGLATQLAIRFGALTWDNQTMEQCPPVFDINLLGTSDLTTVVH